MEQECNKCHIIKKIDEFKNKKRNGKKIRLKICLQCENSNNRDRYQNLKINNPSKYRLKLDERKKVDKKRYSRQKQQIKKQQSLYYQKNKEKIKKRRHEFKKNNPERVKNWKNSYRDSLEGKIGMNLRKRVRTEIGSGKQWLELLYCTFQHLKKWFEFNFELDKNHNFNWNNYGKVWTIDHVKPCKSFNLIDPIEAKKCFNWRNTLPVTKKYNQEKSGKIICKDIIKLNERIMLFEKVNRLKLRLPKLYK